MRVLQVSRNIGPLTGIGSVAYELSKALERQGHDVHNICASVDEGISLGKRFICKFSRSMDRRVRVPYIGLLFSHIAFSVEALFFLLKNRKHYDITVWHGQGVGVDLNIVHSIHREAIYSKVRSRRFAWLLNPLHYILLIQEFVSVRIMRGANFVCISESEFNALGRIYNIPKNRRNIIRNGVDLDRWRFVSNPLIEGVEAVNFYAVLAANEFDRKGLREILSSMPEIIRRHPGFTLVVAGGGNRAPYEAMIDSLNIGKNCIFLGPRSDLPEIFSGACFSFLLSDYEPFGLVGIESLACGTPVLATEVGGMAEYVRPGVNGFFVDRSVASIVQGVDKILENLPKCARTVSACRGSVDLYSWFEVGKQYNQVLISMYKEKEKEGGDYL